MPKVQVTSHIEIDVDEVLEGVARLNNQELTQFVDRVIALRAQRNAVSLPKNEADLLEQINRGVRPDVRVRYDELNGKLHDETITPEEHQELLEISDQIELADAERLRHLTTLAQLRNVSVDTLMTQLGIRRANYA
ncbi:MAG: hypothetical protein U0768_09635 [Anaerolineae bacterium]